MTFSPIIISVPLILSLGEMFAALNIGALALSKLISGALICSIALFLLYLRALRGGLAAAKLDACLSLYLLFLGVTAISVVRSIFYSPDLLVSSVSKLFLLVSLLSIAYIYSSRVNEVGVERAARGVYLSLWVYVSLNIALYVFGVDGPNTGHRAMMLNSLGIDQPRAHFPLSAGVNAFGPIGASLVCASYAVMVHGRKYTLVTISGLILGLASILLVDSRGAMLLAIISCLGVSLSNRFKPLFALMPAVMVVSTPLVIWFTLAAVHGPFNIDILDGMARSGGQDFSSNRAMLWLIGSQGIDFASAEFYFGQGFRGVYDSGVLREMAHVVDKDIRSNSMTMHNAVLELLFDIGVFGVVLFACMYSYMLGRIGLQCKRRGGFSYSLLGILTALLLSGFLESSPTIHHDSFIFWVLAATAAVIPGANSARSSVNRYEVSS